MDFLDQMQVEFNSFESNQIINVHVVQIFALSEWPILAKPSLNKAIYPRLAYVIILDDMFLAQYHQGRSGGLA